MSAPIEKLEEMGQRKKAIYSEEFQAMLDKLEEEDYADRSSSGGGNNVWMRKNRLCIEQVKVLEKHFEVENKLQPERKIKIAEELGLEPRQVAIWFQNRRARWKAKQLEKEYDKLRASYETLKHDYGSLQQERQALLTQLKDLKAKIEARTPNDRATISITANDPTLNSSDISLNVSLPTSSASSSCRTTMLNPFIPMTSSSMSSSEGHQLWKAYQNQIARIEDQMGMFSNEESCNIFSVDQAPTLHWHHGDQFYKGSI